VSVAHRRLVADAYHRAAYGFAGAADALIYRILAQPLATAVEKIVDARSGPVLDIAAGVGAFGRAFPDVVAIDIAAGQLAANGAAHRVMGDAELLPFRPDTFAAAGCSFGINHMIRPVQALREMARVAPVVGLCTWLRPEAPYAPKCAVQNALERQVGHSRTPIGKLLDRLGNQVGSVEAVTRLLASAALEARVSAVDVEVPWPGLDAYLEYRLSMPTTATVGDLAALRQDVAQALVGLSADELTWRLRLVIGLGTR
jgi:hypothetical protein